MSNNDITGDEIKTKPSSQSYRDNYDRIFKKKPMDAATITREYEYLGSLNSGLVPPEGKWRRFNQNRRGTYEVYCCDKLRSYYDVYCD